ILTKVGVYAVLRLWTLCFPAGASGLFETGVLVWGGIATLGFGAIGMFVSQTVGRLAAFSIIASSGTLLAAVGFNLPELASGALYYLASSTLAGGALFLLVELLGRVRLGTSAPTRVDDGKDSLPIFLDAEPPAHINLDDDEQSLVGRAIPVALAYLGLAFTVCGVIIAGLPPLSGFVGKLAMLLALLDLQSRAAWTLFALLIGSGLMASMALIRIGMRHFWSSEERPPLRLHVFETLPVALLLSACV